MSKASRTFTLTKDGKAIPQLKTLLEEKTLRSILSNRKLMRTDKAVILASTQPKNTVDSHLACSFPSCIYEAYNHHLHLILRPDDIWLGIMTVFANYVTFHSEELKEFFQPCQVLAFSSTNDYKQKSLQDWMKVIEDLSDGMPIAQDVKHWMIPDFSTTTEQDRTIGRLCFLGGMQKFATYGIVGSCGIPQVTLEGTLDDWKSLRSKVSMLHEYGIKSGLQQLCWWNELLQEILAHFVDSYVGNPDHEFWQSCVHVGRICGSGIQGWILAFSPWEADRWRLCDINDIKITKHYGEFDKYKEFNVPSTTQIEVAVCGIKPGSTVVIYGGGIASSFDSNTQTIRPNFDFVVFDMPVTASFRETKPKKIHEAPIVPTIAELHVESGLPMTITTTQHEHSMYLCKDVYAMCYPCYAKNPKARQPRGLILYTCRRCNSYICPKCAIGQQATANPQAVTVN